MFAAQRGAFPGHRVITPDARGFGQSPTPTEEFRHDQDLIRLLDALGIEKAVLVGISMGAQTAVDVALENPGRVEALVISGGGGGCPDWTDPWIIDINRRLDEAAAGLRPEEWVETFLEVIPGPRRALRDIPPAIVEQQRDMVSHTLAQHITPPIQQGRAPIVTTQLPGARQRLPELRIPVLAIHGALDSPDHLRFAARAANQETAIENAKHYPNMEAPAEFAELVSSFLTLVLDGSRA